MPVSQFHRPVLNTDGSIDVSGPFTPDPDEAGRISGEVTVRFVLVQAATHGIDREADTVLPRLANGVGHWNGGADWEGTVEPDDVPSGFRASPHKGSPGKEGIVRGVATAVWASTVPQERLPAMQTLMWCVTTEVIVEAAKNEPEPP